MICFEGPFGPGFEYFLDENHDDDDLDRYKTFVIEPPFGHILPGCSTKRFNLWSVKQQFERGARRTVASAGILD
jgi:hypothetical protein